MSDSLVFNPISAECTVVPCLYQVAHNNPAAQLSGCQSLFGFPLVPTVTSAADPVFSTVIETSTYTDIIISTSTAYSTVDDFLTSTETVSETATQYTTTVVNTVSATVTVTPAKKKKRRRDFCKGKSSTTPASSAFSASSTISAVSSEAPSSLAPSSSAPPSSAPSSSSAPPSSTSATPLFPLATDCPSLPDYSSACACLEPTTVTEYHDPITSIIHQTSVTTISSTTEAVVTVVTTTIIVKPATTTLTSTLSTLTTTTTTVQQTTTLPPPVPTSFGLVLRDGVNVGRSAALAGTAPAFTFVWAAGVSPATLHLDTSAGPAQPVLASGATYKMYVRLSTTSYGIVFFTTASYVSTSAYTWLPVTCALNPVGLAISCSTTTGFVRFLQCGSNFYMANASTLPGGCAAVTLGVSS